MIIIELLCTFSSVGIVYKSQGEEIIFRPKVSKRSDSTKMILKNGLRRPEAIRYAIPGYPKATKTLKFPQPRQTANCKLQTANCKLQTANCKLQTANCKLQTANCKLQTANRKLLTPQPGISNQKVDPLPSSVSTLMRPLCLLTISDEMY